MVGELAGEPALQPRDAGQAEVGRAAHRLRVGLPFLRRALVAADVHQLEREHLDELVQDVADHVDGGVGNVEHMRGDAPGGADLEHAARLVAQLRVGRDGGLGVAG
jgi:hypothetical protein